MIPNASILRKKHLNSLLLEDETKALMIGESFDVSSVIVKRMRKTNTGFKQISISKNLVGRVQHIKPVLSNTVKHLVENNYLNHGITQLQLQTWIDGSTLAKL